MKKFLSNMILPVLLALVALVQPVGAQQAAPKPYGAIPSGQQMDWQKMEYYMFVHFGPNTFTNVEWGDGSEDPSVFNPTDLDCRQWAATAKAAGMTGIILTAKHHDGFCLWPSKYSTHTVRESPWKDGKGDVLKELSEACREYGLKLGVYLSPWDRNHPAYGTPEYNRVFANMLGEVLSNYGEVFEQWFDGANGEGPNGKQQVYDWNMFHEVVFRNQPRAIIFSDVGPGCRWMGNESGVAGETNWSTLNIKGYEPGRGAPPIQQLSTGVIGGEAWVPAETDVSVRSGWFYSPTTNDRVKTTDKLMDIYYTSVGRNSNLLLNVPPDTRGRIHPSDSLRLMEFRRAREEAFKDDLIAGATVKASNTRGGSSKYAAGNVADGNFETYWATDDGQTAPYLEIDLGGEKTFNRLLLQEYTPLGQRVESFAVKSWDGKGWVALTDATTIGYKRILRFPAVTTRALRIEMKALASPLISTIGIYRSPELLSVPVVGRDRAGMVSLRCETPDPVIYYTTDGTEPSDRSAVYEKPFPMPEGGTVKAVAMVDGARRSETVTTVYDIASAKWTVTAPSMANIANVIDGNVRTSAEIGRDEALTIDLGGKYTLRGFTYTPVGRVQAANIYRYDFWVSGDGRNWTQVKKGAEFGNITNDPVRQEVMFDAPVAGRYIRIKPLETVGGKTGYLVAEIGVITGSGKADGNVLGITPLPVDVILKEGVFTLDGKTVFVAGGKDVEKVAAYFAARIKMSTGNVLKIGKKRPAAGYIHLAIVPDIPVNDEGYLLDVTPGRIDVKAKTPRGLFYGMQTVMQLLPPEIESPVPVKAIEWNIPAVSIKDEPRFGYRGMHLDVSRHFADVDFIKKQLDVLAMFKINRFHWHLTDDQGWRIEIKKYPGLTRVGAQRIEGEGNRYGPYFFTQAQVREIVAYAGERFIEVIPEIELPGHAVAAIAAYPELSCTGEQIDVRNIWGVANDVYCAGNELVFEFLENVIAEVVPLFESDYFHIGGDECPKGRWEECPLCQARIKELGLVAKDGHTAEEMLQSWFVQRIEKVLLRYGKKMIGWDEILEGGLAPTATVMSWRGEEGGIAAANMGHDVIMTPGNWMYLDKFQGDPKIQPVTIGGYMTLEKVYGYEPVPAGIADDKKHHILGPQANVWTEYKYNGSDMEHDIYPRIIALAELAWTPAEKKDYKDFERRLDDQRVRLDMHGVNYYIPMPEQAGAPSCNFVAFTDRTTLAFKTTEPVKMVYTIDGSEPALTSPQYTAPLTFTGTTTLKIRSVLPSGKMSAVRTIAVEKQGYAPAVKVGADVREGIKAEYFKGYRRAVAELDGLTPGETEYVEAPQNSKYNVRGAREVYPDDFYSTILTGYMNIPEDGVYYFSTDYELWIDGKLFISNEADNHGTARRFSRSDRSVALAGGFHSFKLIRMGAIFGGWPTQWSGVSIAVRKDGQPAFRNMDGSWFR